MKNKLLLLLFFFHFSLSAQREADCFAMGRCLYYLPQGCDPPYGSAIYKFNEEGLEYIEEYAGLNLSTSYSRAAFSDRHTGELLFASNGWRLVNRSGQVLADKLWRDDIPWPGDNPDTSGVLNTLGPLFLNDPGDSTKAYLFYGQYLIRNWGGDLGALKLDALFTYAYLDIPTQSLISKGNVLLNEPTAPGDMAACRHANGRDWWLIKPGAYDDENFIGIVGPQGVSLEKQAYPGMQHRRQARTFTYFNQHGDKMLRFVSQYQELHAYDFDRCSGALSNLTVHDLSDSIEAGDWNACTISPDGTKFYVRRSPPREGTLQYDLETSEYTHITDISSAPQLTPNYKHILFGWGEITANDSMYQTLSTIYEPNKPGIECNFVRNTDTVINIPNFFSPSCFANFRLGKIEGSSCDTIVNSISEVKAGRLKVYPNPNRGQFIVEFNAAALRTIRLYNVLGQLVYSVRTGEQLLNLEISSLNVSPGLFLLEVMNEENNEVFKSKIIYEK